MNKWRFGYVTVLVLVASCGGNAFDTASTDATGGPGPGIGGSSSGSGGSQGTSGSGGSIGSAGSYGSGGSLGSGGSTQTGGMTGSGGSNGSGGSTQTGGSYGSGGSVSSDGGVSCTDLLSKSNTLLAEAQVCTGNVAGECGSTVVGWCCPVLVASTTSAITTEYLNALANYNSHCPHACPGFCLTGTTGTCGVPVDGGLRRCVRTGIGDAG